MENEKMVNVMIGNTLCSKHLKDNYQLESLATARFVIDRLRKKGYKLRNINCVDSTVSENEKQFNCFIITVEFKIPKEVIGNVKDIMDVLTNFFMMNKIFYNVEISFDEKNTLVMKFISKNNDFDINDVTTIFNLKYAVSLTPAPEIRIPKAISEEKKKKIEKNNKKKETKKSKKE